MPIDPPAPSSDQNDTNAFRPRRFGRYWLLRLIARGGMGEVYLGATTGIEGAERPCVVKIIRREHAKDSSFLARFLDEARVQAQLQHPGVVQVFEASKDELGEPYVVVEYVEGRSLGEVRNRATNVGYRLSWCEAVALAASTAEALTHVHERTDARGSPLGIVHRDMSPQNIMVSFGGDAKLIDFGTARGQNRRCHTVSGVVFAKPGYVAPEVANGNSGDARVDLYALGIMMWELGAARRFLEGEPSEHLAAVAKGARQPPPIAHVIGAPASLDEVVAKLTAHRADDRYATARTALTDLTRMLAQAPSLPNGERGVRSRISHLMATLYPSEPTQSRRTFAQLVALARRVERQDQASAQVAPLSGPTNDAADAAPDATPDSRLLPGTRYRILRKIGEGAMGTVYEAEHVDLGRRLALKVLAAVHATSPEYAARFRREARSLSRLSHPNLVTMHDFGQSTDGRLYCVMELLEGETLDRRLSRDGALDWERAMQLGAQAAAALRDAHEAGLVHRDIKPSNLFLCTDGTLKLLDFGVAKTPEEAGEPAEDRTGLVMLGTPEYMAPEQIAGAKVDARADLYALGCVLYEMCTGRLPHAADSLVALMDAKLHCTPEAPSSRAPARGVPSEVDGVIMRALQRDPAKRFTTASHMLEQIGAALRSPARRRRTRRVLGWLTLSSALLASLAVLGIAAEQRYPDRVREIVAQVERGVQPLRFVLNDIAPPPAVSNAAPALDALASVARGAAAVRSGPGVAADAGSWRAMGADAPQRLLRDAAQQAMQRGDEAAAVELGRRWLDQSGSHDARMFLAKALLKTGNAKAAADILDSLGAGAGWAAGEPEAPRAVSVVPPECSGDCEDTQVKIARSR